MRSNQLSYGSRCVRSGVRTHAATPDDLKSSPLDHSGILTSNDKILVRIIDVLLDDSVAEDCPGPCAVALYVLVYTYIMLYISLCSQETLKTINAYN